MSDDSKIGILLDLVKENRLDLKENKEKLNDINIVLNNLNTNVDKNTTDLAEHMRRTKLLEGRVDSLEEPGKAKNFLWNKYSKTCALLIVGSAAITAIYKLVVYILPLLAI